MSADGNTEVVLASKKEDGIPGFVRIPRTIEELLEILSKFKLYGVSVTNELALGYPPQTPIIHEAGNDQLVFSVFNDGRKGSVVGTLPCLF